MGDAVPEIKGEIRTISDHGDELMYQKLYANVIYPIYHRAIGSGALKAIRELKSHDYFSSEELHDYEREKLRRLLSESFKSIPYYRNLIEQTGCGLGELAEPSNFRQFPVLSKSLIRENGEQLRSENLNGNQLDRNSTSGSTGSPLHFYTDRRSKSFRKASVIRNYEWLGIHIGDRIVHLWGSPIDQLKAQAIRGRIHSFVTRETYLDAYSIGDNDFALYARIIQRNGASLLSGYPSVLSRFASFCDGQSIKFPKLKAIISSAETLYDHHRQTIQSCIQVPLFDRYGCREVGAIAHEIPGVKGLVVNSDRILVEVVNDQGEHCTEGELGRILVTDLDNYGMPLIRYEIGDLGCWANQSTQNSKLPYPVLARVEGRSLDVVVSREGNRVGGTFWTILFRRRPGIIMFQVVQTSLDGVLVRYVRDRSIQEIETAYFDQKIKEKCGAEFGVEFIEVDKIEPEKNGKFRIVISSVADSSIETGQLIEEAE